MVDEVEDLPEACFESSVRPGRNDPGMEEARFRTQEPAGNFRPSDVDSHNELAHTSLSPRAVFGVAPLLGRRTV
ncbi:MAG: hypothetical protein DMG23_00960 [Acidobacteria bacterium]|nr:MAG: hypothetical protein DMG23_00960 [Acidobacteriota bacterium]